ncbi:acyltransferase family protein [Curtobacterium poinsettiae]|uniref:Acyltransferase n=1 Tax=Curtobacterium poinsettiae TaxID=159612 RepID=A0ABT3S504_9MICO|nr:acyltransferase [Curtobacterium flaccumfaciens]MBT1611368.1 acyltransferase [Curtobacterium flaccumfaciens pv. poinsettiae]MCX2849909.1 acyltransferase [Curtobacterium flaccumfaciens pv. poinsettiae]UXN19514.1 acyltransferase [Curtobacterium flaccumfaciens pv. poinsettiae]
MTTERASGRIQGLDVLRGAAITLVLLRHSWPDVFGMAGVVGVVVFFALSGYLITGVLVTDLHRAGHVRYGRFYRNRALRLLPALFLMLIGFAVVSLVWNPLGDRETVLRSVVVSVTYTMNIPFNHGSDALSHLWTLATEEQFYLVWPLVLAVGIRLKKVRILMLACAAGILLAMIATMIITTPTISRIYPLPTSWCLAMIIGAAAYFGQNFLTNAHNGKSFRPAASWISVGAAIVILALSALPEAKDSPLTYLLVGPLAASCTVVLIAHLRTWEELPVKALRPLMALGLISYAAYLWNYPIHMWISADPDFPFPGLSTIALTLAAAIASWFLVEMPASKLKHRLDVNRRRVKPEPTVS